MQSGKNPVAQDRVQVLDVLRGFALAGILSNQCDVDPCRKGIYACIYRGHSIADRTLQDLILFFCGVKVLPLSSRSCLELVLRFKFKALKNREIHFCRVFHDVWPDYCFLACYTSRFFGIEISW
jgi:hypothetical protein